MTTAVRGDATDYRTWTDEQLHAEFYTSDELAELLGMSKTIISGQIMSGKLTDFNRVKINNRYWYERAAVEEYRADPEFIRGRKYTPREDIYVEFEFMAAYKGAEWARRRLATVYGIREETVACAVERVLGHRA